MKKRGFCHHTPLSLPVSREGEIYNLVSLLTPHEQLQRLREKGCECKV